MLKGVARNNDKNNMENEERHVAELFLFDFEQCGIHLPEDDRKAVVYYNDYILQRGHRFMENCVAPSIIPQDTVPSAFRHL